MRVMLVGDGFDDDGLDMFELIESEGTVRLITSS